MYIHILIYFQNSQLTSRIYDVETNNNNISLKLHQAERKIRSLQEKVSLTLNL